MTKIDEVQRFISYEPRNNEQRQGFISTEIRDAKSEISNQEERRAAIEELRGEAAESKFRTARLKAYKPAANSDPTCPNCLMRTGEYRALYAVSSKAGCLDTFACHDCSITYDIGFDKNSN